MGDFHLVAGGGGFVGGHLTSQLLAQGKRVHCVDRKPIDRWQQVHEGAENIVADLREPAHCRLACDGASHVYNLAANMGGMGFIETHRADCMLSVLISTNLILAARDARVERYFYASSACVYAADKQKSTEGVPLKESDAYPAMPEDGYGWEKLFSERMCRHFCEDFGLATRVARFHNIYGPCGAWEGGREKAPAALCRKVIHAKATGDLRVEIWGDGTQTRSFTYVDDCITGILKVTDSDLEEPVNLGSDEVITINGLVDIVEEIAGVQLQREYQLDAPKGVNGRNSDNSKIRECLGWEPTIRVRDGMKKTYAWIEQQYLNRQPS